MNKLAATTLLLALAPAAAHADINMMQASFKTDAIDLQIDGLNLSRSYDSRSTYSGLFGFGWCSTLDTELVRVERTVASTSKQEELELRDCGTRRPATADMKPKIENDSYIIKRKDGVLMRFAKDDGRLTGLRSPGHTEVQILRARGAMPPPTNLPRNDATGEGNKRNQVRMELDDSGRIVRIEAEQSPHPGQATSADTPTASATASSADFLYGPEGNLLKTRNAWSNTYLYKYDRLHNLTEIAYPDNTKEVLTYDSDYDRVTSFQGRNNCKETYRHTIDPTQKKQLSQVSIATLTCPHKAPIETRFEFKFKKRQDNRWALAKLSLTRDGKTQSTQYKLGGLQ